MTSIDNLATEPNTTMIEASFNFWFNDNEHIRSPFPAYITDDLKQQTIARFNKWTENISDQAEKEVNDEILVEKLEEILFENALSLVKTDDEKITVQYPFLPRLNDLINPKDDHSPQGESRVTERMIIKKGDESLLKVKLLNLLSSEEWETEFELPE